MVVIVDDGIATGSTVLAAVRVSRALEAESVVVATPVAPADTGERLRRIADQVVVLDTPTPFYAVGQAYLEFGQTNDDEVTRILGRSQAEHMDPAARKSCGWLASEKGGPIGPPFCVPPVRTSSSPLPESASARHPSLRGG